MAERTIVLKGTPERYEGKSDSTIYPGYLIRQTSTGLAVHATAGQKCAAMFAIEDSLQGNDIDDAYTSGNQLQYVHARPGDEILAVLKNGQNVAKGALLESGGDGTLQAYAADSAGAAEPDVPIAFAREALNLSTSAIGDVLSERRIVVQIL